MFRQLLRAAAALSAVFAVTLMFASSASALSLRVNVAGVDQINGGLARYTARIEGLVEDGEDQAATAFVIESFTDSNAVDGDLDLFAEGSDVVQWSGLQENSISILGGDLQSVRVISRTLFFDGVETLEQDRFGLSFFFDGDEDVVLLVNAENDPDFDLDGIRIEGGEVSFERISAVPIPAAAPLLIAGLGLLFGLGRRRKFA